MMCYRDQTFCTASTDGRCVNTECSRFFGPEQTAGALEWWGKPGAPIAFGDMARNCESIVSPTECGKCYTFRTAGFGRPCEAKCPAVEGTG